MVVNPVPSSAAGRMAERIRTAAVAAAAQSAALTRLRRLHTAWLRLAWPERRLKGGAVLAVAALVHLVLIGRPHGWPEFIIPLTALVIGLFAMASSVLRPLMPSA